MIHQHIEQRIEFIDMLNELYSCNHPDYVLGFISASTKAFTHKVTIMYECICRLKISLVQAMANSLNNI